MSVSGMIMMDTAKAGTGITSSSRNLAVKVEAEGKYALASSSAAAVGIIDGDPLNGVISVVRMGKTRAVAGGSITCGNYVKSGANGKLVDAGAMGGIAATTNVVGQALEAAVANQVFTVWVQPVEITKPAT